MEFLKKFWPILFLAAVFLLLFYKVFFLGYVFYDGDNFHLNIPEKYFFVQQILQGHIPLWNPYLFLGIPYLADLNLGIFNPVNILYFLFPIARALSILVVLDFLGISIGMYLLLRNFSLSNVSSLFGAVIMSLGGIPFILFTNVTQLNAIVYIPFIFLLARKFITQKTYLWFFLLCLAEFLQIISGHPQETYYTMLFTALYLLIFFPTSFLKRILFIIAYIFIPIILASFQLIPFLEYVLHANRPVGNVLYAGWGGITLLELATFIFPTFFGSHLTGTWWGPQKILVGFVGIPTLFLLFVGIAKGKLPQKLYYVLGLIGAFIISFGNSFPFFFLFYFSVPGLALFRLPSGILVFYTFFVAILAAFGLEYLHIHKSKYKKMGIWLSGIGALLTTLFVTIHFFANKQSFWKETLQKLAMHVHVFSKLLIYDTNKLHVMLQGIVGNTIFVGVFLCLTGLVLKLTRKNQAISLLGITVFGFLYVNSQSLLLAPINYYKTGDSIPSVLFSVEGGKYRILSLPVNFHESRDHLASANYFYDEGKANMSLYEGDNNMQQQLYQVSGYTSLIPRSYVKFIGENDTITNVTNIDFSHITQKQLNLSSVKYLLSHEQIQNYNAIPLQLVAAKPNAYYIYENKNAFPRAYVLENPSTPVIWQKTEATVLSLVVDTLKPSHVIISDWYYPGWKAYVNGKQVGISPYLSTFQELSIPSGKSFIQLKYDPLSFKVGILISIIAFIALVSLFILFRERKT